jgi:DNA-binding NtrC family response regulator
MPKAQIIMVVSHDPKLGDVRKAVLEAAGFQVLAVSNIKEVKAACQKCPQLVMIGYSLPSSAKRQVWAEVSDLWHPWPFKSITGHGRLRSC